jgi:hypothetical protein
LSRRRPTSTHRRSHRTGHWLAYGSNANKKDEVYVRSFPGGGAQWQISITGGTEPVWSHSGRELFYRDAGGMLVSAVIRTDPEFQLVSRQRLFSAAAYRADSRNRSYGSLWTISPSCSSIHCSLPRVS